MRFSSDDDDGAIAVATTTAPATARIARGSAQQEAFWGELRAGAGNLLLEARAGTGKSSSCREGMWRLLEADRSLAIGYTCFNGKIAEEFAATSPPTVDVGTMNSFGLRALKDALGCEVLKEKTYNLLDQLPGGSALKGYVRRSIARLVSLAKNAGCRPGEDGLPSRLAGLLDSYDIETWRRHDQVIDYSLELLDMSAAQTRFVDFDDMLWLPVLLDLRFPGRDFLFIDEVQDLNPLQHELAVVMGERARTVIVGDPYQAIYGWRGASTESIAVLGALLEARTLPLTVTWRCPRRHVELARELVPDFEAAPGAEEGVLRHGEKGLIDEATPGDLVLCRANAPIVQACLRQIARRVPAVVRGRAVGDQLLGVYRKAERVGGLDAPTIPAFVRNLAVWRAGELTRLAAKDGVEHLIEAVQDQAACLDAIAASCATPPEIPGVIRDLFTDDRPSNRVNFSSVHRAKGSEARRVTYLQVAYSEKRDRVRPPQQWELDQRRNLRYVALTRSLDSLTLVA